MTNRVQTIYPLALAALFAVELTGHANGQSPPLWGKLSPGSHAVGFRTVWQLDYSRRYKMTFGNETTYATGKAPRPILINIWYPAKSADGDKAMRHRDYLEIRSAEPPLARFSGALADYVRVPYAQELPGKSGEGPADRGKHLLDDLLDIPTPSVRDAAAAEGQFPLVIYHAGAGSTFDDNSVLCEFLASHGYVVFGSAFQEPSGASFNVDGKHTSARDMAFLIGYAKQLPNVDWHHVGVIGHSAGAHATLMYGEEIQRVRGNLKSVNAVAFSPDGRWTLAAGGGAQGGDNAIRVWDAQSG